MPKGKSSRCKEKKKFVFSVTKVADCYDVVYLDYGNYEKVPDVLLHELEAEFSLLTAQAVPCSLSKVRVDLEAKKNRCSFFSLSQTLPVNNQWVDHPEAVEYFKELVSGKFVDATFYLKQSNSFWPLSFVDLKLSVSKIVRKFF